jgi:molybdate transport system ATP-binding protein
VSLVADVQVEQGSFRLDARVKVHDGEVLGLLGPNGAGKTTLLRTLAGALVPRSGHIALAGRVLTDTGHRIHLSMHERRVSVMYQDYLLFDHLTVLENVAFGQRARGRPKGAARATANLWVDRLGLADVAGRRPTSLSGGQRQRTALARTLAADPDLLLLDEPLSALDATTRDDIRADLRHHLRATGKPTILVTHDAVEAMLLADRLLVLEDGVVTHVGTPAEVAENPRTAYVAGLLGLNLLTGDAQRGSVALSGGGSLEAADTVTAGPVVVLVPPAAVVVHLDRPPAGSPRNVWPAIVARIEASGERDRLRCAGSPPMLVDITPAALADLHLLPGTPVWLSVKASAVRLSGNAVRSV